MKVLVVGAAGKTGRAVVGQAVKQGHDVTALVRTDGYDVPGVAVRVGDARDAKTMESAVAGQDAVIDTVGGKTPTNPRPWRPTWRRPSSQPCNATTSPG